MRFCRLQLVTAEEKYFRSQQIHGDCEMNDW
jgi:hypothetical protein